ncbi:VOC family protein [Flavobacterium sp.]|uniref:VOC family protein n=1 Tax=Flavobacterium sp. TaxID=239 RepID=UPI00261D4D8D|nr:VOC family protein [Flavobacterium sp.]
MTPRFLGLRTTIYKVSDLEKAKLWYNALFETAPYFDEPFYVGYNIAGYELGLQPEENPITTKEETVLTFWGVEDVNAEFERMVSLGATVHENPMNVGGEIMVATVKDPWENIIGIIYNPEFKLPSTT